MPDPLADPTRTQPAPAPPSATDADIGASLPVRSNDDPPLRASPHPGDLGRLGRYRVLKRLGAGGMGAVYLAFDDGLRRRLALKVMLPRYAAHPAARHRFLREARTAAAVRSPHVVAIHDVDENGDTPFIAMEYLEGTPLDQFLKQTPGLTVPQVVRIAREAAAGLAAAHAAGLVHRDVKPANLWLQAPHGRVKLLDFGLAREEAEEGTQVTGTGDVVGTPAYMSPEQARGERVDARTDLFSLGVLLYRLAAGRLPFTGPTAMAVLTSLAVDDPPPVRSRNPDVPEPLAALIHRLLAKKPDDRPRSADEVAAALAALDGVFTPGVARAPIAVAVQAEGVWDGIDAAPEATTEAEVPVARKRRGFPWLAVGGAVATVVVAGMLVAVALNRVRPTPEPPAAKVEPEQLKPTPPKPVPKADPDRRAAEALHPHCLLRVSLAPGKEVTVYPKDQLPAEPFKVIEVLVEHLTSPNRDTFFAAVAELRELRHLADGYQRLTLTEADLARFAAMPFADRLSQLSVPAVELTAASVTTLARFTRLTHLTIKAEGATDAVLKQLAGTLPGLRSLILIGLGKSGGVTADGFAAVTGLPLQTLWLNDCLSLTREWGAQIGRMPGVQRLVLNNCSADDDILSELVACKQLTSLTCTGPHTKVTNDGMKAVARMPLLQMLDVDGLPIDDTGLGYLQAVQKLKGLVLLRTNVTAAGVMRFKAARPECGIRTEKYDPALDPDRVAAEWAFAKGGNVTLAGPVWVTKAADLPLGSLRVTEFNLVSSKYAMVDADLDLLTPLTGLTGLSTGMCQLTDDGLEKLSRCPAAKSMTSLALAAPKLTEDGLKHLKAFRALTKIALGYTTVSGEGFAVLRDLPVLTHLYLGSSQVTDKGLEHIRNLHQITYIDLRLSKVTDEGIAAVVGLPKLTYLGMTSTKVTDATLERLAGAKQLTLISVTGTKVTRDGVAAFKKAVPTCEVQSDFDVKP